MEVVLVNNKIKIFNGEEIKAEEIELKVGKKYEVIPIYCITVDTDCQIAVYQDGFVPIENYTAITEEEDIINKPKHYTQAGIEAIDYLKSTMSKEAYQGFLEGNVKKYMHRFRFKNGIEDLKKANWYLNKLIKELEE